MKAMTLIKLVDGLGQTYDGLIAEGLIPPKQLKPLLDTPDNIDLIQNPVPGVKLWFRKETGKLEKVMVTLIQTVGQKVYTGELPLPFKPGMNQSMVRRLLGAPVSSREPAKLPAGLGVRGGSDTFNLDAHRHPNTQVTLGYLENTEVNNICFSLKHREHE